MQQAVKNAKQTPVVTIGLPFRNEGQRLLWAIASIKLQTFPNWELILVNDQSTDDTAEIARNFASKDTRITLVEDGENKGLPARLNQIATLCKTRYLFRMDADDIMCRTRLATQLAYLSNHDIDVVGSSVIIIDDEDVIRGVRKGNPARSLRKQIYRNHFFTHPSVAGKTAWFKENPYDVNLNRSQDFDLWTRTFDTSSFALIKEPLLFYRESNTFNINIYRKNQYSRRSVIVRLMNENKISSFEAINAIIISHVKTIVYTVLQKARLDSLVSSKTRNERCKIPARYKTELAEILKYRKCF